MAGRKTAGLTDSAHNPYTKEPLYQWSAAFGGAFDAILRFEKLEIHKVFLPFSNLVLRQTLSPNALAHCIIASLVYHTRRANA